MGHPLPPKKDVVAALLEKATVFLHLDPRKQGVVVPQHFRGQPQLVLQVGYAMAVPIPDLKIDDDGVTCTLSFGGRPFWCSMPWSAIYAMVGEDGRGMVWPDDLPPEVARQAMAAAPAPAAEENARRGKKLGAETKAKRPKKKPEAEPAPPAATADIREKIVAIPTKADGESKPGEEQPTETPAPNAQRKPKRELPPYLRVVK